MSDLANAYREFNETDKNIFDEFHTSPVLFFADRWGVTKDDLAGYIAKQWGIYPSGE